MGKRKKAALLAFCEVLFFFGFAVWLYEVGVSWFQPYWLDKQVTHLQEGITSLNWLRNDTLGHVGFALSVIGFSVTRYFEHSKQVLDS